MKKATLVVDEKTNKRNAFAGMLIHHIGVLPDSVIDKFSRNEFRGEIPDRLLFAFSDESETVAQPTPPTDNTQPSARDVRIFTEWCAKWSEFWNMFGVDVSKIMAHPNFPKAPRPGFPWIIVDPGLMDDAVLAETLFKKIGIPYWVSVALLEYTNSVAPGIASAILVRDTTEPDKEYLGKSADDADVITETKGTRFILRRHWVILFAFLWWLTKGKQKLDVKGWTRFPKNRLSGGGAARGYWGPTGGEVRLSYYDGGRRGEVAGPREGNFFTL